MAQATQTKSLPELAGELWELVRTYAKEQTIEPVKGLGRFVAFGMAGSAALGIGLVLVFLAVLRALQSETGDVFERNWSWVPYVITLVGCAVVAALALTKTRRDKGRDGPER